MNIIIYSGPISISEVPSDDLKMKAESLQAKIKSIDEEMNQLFTTIKDMDSKLSSLNHDVISELEQVTVELESLIRQQKDSQESLHVSEQQVLKPDSKRAKDLYRKIAQKCHPDRTDNQELHEIFRRSVESRAKGDVELLEYLFREIEDVKPSLLRSLMNRIKGLEIELKQKEGKLFLFKIENQQMIKILPVYTNNVDLASSAFRMSVQSIILQKKRMLLRLQGVSL